MAFKPAVATTVTTSTFAKADAFLNLYVPSASGRKKVGAIPLKNSRAYEAALIERLSGDPDAVAAMHKVLVLDFQLVSTEAVPVSAVGF